MSQGEVTTNGLRGVRPGREATTGVNLGPSGGLAPRRSPRRARGGRGEISMVPDADFTSYYGKPVINQPVWAAPDIPAYLFLGGLAGASSVLAAGAELTGRPGLARAAKLGATAAAGCSLAALVHDLGRPRRFLNMLRTFKLTSPMSVGSWLLAAYAPASALASLSAVSGRLERLGLAGTAAAAAIGPGLATYTAALLSDTAVPSWHDGHRQMPFVFASSAATAAAGLGLAGSPVDENGPARRLGMAAGLAEVATMRWMERSAGLSGEAYRTGKAGRYGKLSSAVTLAGTLLAGVLGRRSRTGAVAAGAALLAGSALERLAIFQSGFTSANDPKYTVVPQRARLEERKGAHGPA